MAKQFLEDMVRIKRSRQQEESRSSMKAVELREERAEPKPEPRRVKTFPASKKKGNYKLWIVAIISLAILVFAISFFFARASVVVIPKSQSVDLNENLSAGKDSTTGLPFDLEVISGEQDSTIQASGEKNVSVKATGSVYIYNAYSSASQHLLIDTRLEGSNGKIYKTLTATTVPGMSKSGTPGRVQVQIYADAPGADSNSAPLDFTIIGFKGTAKYAKFYARSVGNITGGFVGQAPNISTADQTTADDNLKAELQTKLLAQATNQVPPGFILFKNAVFLDADESSITSVSNSDGSATLSLKGTLYGILFDQQKLTAKIAADTITSYDGSDVYIPNISSLTFALSNQDNPSFADAQNINFNLTGNADIVWKLDVNKFTSDLLGKSKKDFSQILSQYPNITSATLTISPLWKGSIPSNAKDVKVIVDYPSS